MRTDWRDGDHTRSVEVNADGDGRWRVVIDGVPVDVAVEKGAAGRLRVSANGSTMTALVTPAGDRRFVRLDRMDFVVERSSRASARKRGAADGGLEAPMPGVVTKILVAAGDEVAKGQPLVAVEAMKMEHMIRAPRDGRVKNVLVEQGAMVDGGVDLVALEEPEGA